MFALTTYVRTMNSDSTIGRDLQQKEQKQENAYLIFLKNNKKCFCGIGILLGIISTVLIVFVILKHVDPELFEEWDGMYRY